MKAHMEKSRLLRQSLFALVLLGAANLVGAYFVFSTQRPLLRATSLELVGVEYMVGIRGIREELPAFWQTKREEAAAPDTLAQAQARVDAALENLNTIDARLGAELGTTADFIKLREMWVDAKKLAPAALGETPQKISEVLESINGFVGDASTLVLDPEIDSYYLTDALLLTLPKNASTLNQVLDVLALPKRDSAPSSDIAAPSKADGAAVENAAPAAENAAPKIDTMSSENSQRDALIADAALIAEEIATVAADYRIAFAFNAAIRGELDEARKRFETTNREVLALLQARLRGPAPPLASQAIGPALQEALHANYLLYDKSHPVLAKLLHARVSSASQQANHAYMAIFGLLCAGLLLATRVLRQVARQLALPSAETSLEAPFAKESRPPRSMRTSKLESEVVNLKILVAELVLDKHTQKSK